MMRNLFLWLFLLAGMLFSGAQTFTVTVYAFKEANLEAEKNTNPAFIGFMEERNALEKASLVTSSKREQ